MGTWVSPHANVTFHKASNIQNEPAERRALLECTILRAHTAADITLAGGVTGVSSGS